MKKKKKEKRRRQKVAKGGECVFRAFLGVLPVAATRTVMDFLLPLSVLLLILSPVTAVENQAIDHHYRSNGNSDFLWLSLKRRPLRSASNKISECVFVTSEENVYLHSSEENSGTVCGAYFFTDADKVIEVHFVEVDVPCESGGLVTFFDGWELNGKFFPGVDDHEKSFEERYWEFCGLDRTEKIFTTTQNAGMIHYRVPAKGKGFSFYLKFLPNPAPCNILVESKEYLYTLRNHGRAANCSLVALFPSKIKVLSIAVGVRSPIFNTGTVYQCEEKKISDRLQIGGSEDLDSSRIILFEDICGLDSSPGIGDVEIDCGVSVVRLVSSGLFENSATISIGQLEQTELLQSSFNCGL